jgi:DNA-binding NtrC family response regulator
VDEKTLPQQREQAGILRTIQVSVVRGPDEGLVSKVGEDAIAVGTADGNDLALHDETVSRYHLELERRGDRIRIKDLGSTNGTWLGQTMIESASIAPGTEITIGRTALRIDDGTNVAVELHPDETLGRLRGRSPEMRRLMAIAVKAAKASASVLLIGETGTGKEVIAEAIHEASPRADGPFETVDCGTLMPTLIASELFGHERGAFTGAERQHVGAFERANGGTLFLDEIGELPLALQAMLLGALERRSFRRVGGTKPINVDVRLLCATHRDLRREVNAGNFRQDLFYRIAVVLIRVPSLRERVSDIPVLVEHFLREAGYDGAVEDVVSESALEALKAHDWPGNVRELRNFVEATFAIGDAAQIGLDTSSHPGPATQDRFPSVPMKDLIEKSYKDARAVVLNEFEAIYFKALFERCGGNVTAAAHKAEMNRSYLNQVVRRLRLR